MKKATKQDKSLIVELLALSFDANAGVNYIVRRDGKREERIRTIMASTRAPIL